jgi:hypothetical protein
MRPLALAALVLLGAASPPLPEPVPIPPPPVPDENEVPLYRWEAEDGSVQYGPIERVPPAQRRQARRVDAEVGTVTVDPPGEEAGPEEPDPGEPRAR